MGRKLKNTAVGEKSLKETTTGGPSTPMGKPKEIIKGSDLPTVPNPKVVTEEYLDKVIKERDEKLKTSLIQFQDSLVNTVQGFDKSFDKFHETFSDSLKQLGTIFKSTTDLHSKSLAEMRTTNAVLEEKIKGLKSDKKVIMWGLIIILVASVGEKIFNLFF